MSTRMFGIFPKSGEKILKEALGQFKGIIAQINVGVKKVKSKITANEKRAKKIEAENINLSKAAAEAMLAAENLEALLLGRVVTVPADGEADADETVETDKTEGATSEESE